jgi:hypothetical protein
MRIIYDSFIQKKLDSLYLLSRTPYYFDSSTFLFNSIFLYHGLLTFKYSLYIKNIDNQIVQLKKSKNPVLFRNVSGENFFFIGVRYEVQSFPSLFVPNIEVLGDFNFDYSQDFSI